MRDHTRKGRARIRSISQQRQSLRSLCQQEDVDYKQVWIRMNRGEGFLEAVCYCKSMGYTFKSTTSAVLTLQKDSNVSTAL